MNQFYRALQMPPRRLLRKLLGEKEVYTIAVRPRPTAEGTEPLPALEEDFHLSFPTVFDWNGEIWMLPETGSDHSLRLYRCRAFPTGWELVQRFATDEELCDAILLDRRAEALTILCSETKPDNQLYVRYRRYTLRHAVQESAALPPQGPFELVPDETYNLQHRDFDLVSRNAGPLFVLGEQIIHPTQVSSTVDYGLYLQFLARRGSSEIPLCAATPQNVTITGIAPADLIGVHTYCRDDRLEILDARYLTRLPKIEKAAKPAPADEPSSIVCRRSPSHASKTLRISASP